MFFKSPYIMQSGKNKTSCDDIDWDTWLQVNTINKYSPRPCRDFNFKILHGQINTESKLRYMKQPNGQSYSLSKGMCIICKDQNNESNNVLENLDHLLFYCPNSKRIWRSIQELLSRFSNRAIVVDNVIATTGLWQDGVNTEYLLMNTICSITRFHIWKVRCKIRYGEEIVDFNSNAGLLVSGLRNHMNNLLSSHSNDTAIGNDVNRLIVLIDNLSF